MNIHGQFVRETQAEKKPNMNKREMSPKANQSSNNSSTTSASADKLTVKEYVRQRSQFEGGGSGGGNGENDRPPGGPPPPAAAEVSNQDFRILETSFPRVEFESCFVVTDRNTYAVELNDSPEVIFMNFAKQSMWSSCKYFCDIFNISMAQCIEFVGDELLRQHKVAQALVTYNVAQIPPIKTALKLATYGESNVLLHLCAMALKCLYVLNSTRPTGDHAKALLVDQQLRTVPAKGSSSSSSSATTKKKVKTQSGEVAKVGDLNSGLRCSDFCYAQDEVGQDVQMSFSSQFHLANLLFLTLCEWTLVEKNYHPLWCYVQTNHRFHTSLASTILAQGGLYSTAVLLAKVRGAALDVFVALVKAVKQEIGTDVNYLLYNLSDATLFKECITYLSSVAVDYFAAIKQQRDRLSVHVVDRLVAQLNPFPGTYRPIVSRLSALRHEHRRTTKRRGPTVDAAEEMFPVYCRGFVEAFLAVLVRSVEMRPGQKSQVLNGLKNVNIRYQSHVELLQSDKWQPVDAGYAHAVRVINGRAYIWGSNHIPYVVDDNMTMSLGEVASVFHVKCVC